jgi:thymidylate synthase
MEYLMTPSQGTRGILHLRGAAHPAFPSAVTNCAWWEKEPTREIIDLREVDGKGVFEEDGRLYLNQIEWVIQTYRKFGARNNQMVLQVAHPSDVTLVDPPCLRCHRHPPAGRNGCTFSSISGPGICGAGCRPTWPVSRT